MFWVSVRKGKFEVSDNVFPEFTCSNIRQVYQRAGWNGQEDKEEQIKKEYKENKATKNKAERTKGNKEIERRKGSRKE
jgi:hypothetical protein